MKIEIASLIIYGPLSLWMEKRLASKKFAAGLGHDKNANVKIV